MILPATFRDCRGVERPVADFTPDGEWRQQLDRLRSVLRGDFDRVRVLADSIDVDARGRRRVRRHRHLRQLRRPRALRGGRARGVRARAAVLVQRQPRLPPGARRGVPVVDECGQAVPHAGLRARGDGLDLSTAAGRERAAALSRPAHRRVVPDDGRAADRSRARRTRSSGFFLTYVNSFNEWHEGHAFEPMKDAAALTGRGAAPRVPQPGARRLPAGAAQGAAAGR